MSPVVRLRDAPLIQFRGAQSPRPDKPGDCDCNNPAHWDSDTIYVFNSTGHPWRSSGPDLFHLNQAYQRCEYDNQANGGRWIECTWKADNGVLYGWYHLEPRQWRHGSGRQAPLNPSFAQEKRGGIQKTMLRFFIRIFLVREGWSSLRRWAKRNARLNNG